MPHIEKRTTAKGKIRYRAERGIQSLSLGRGLQGRVTPGLGLAAGRRPHRRLPFRVLSAGRAVHTRWPGTAV